MMVYIIVTVMVYLLWNQGRILEQARCSKLMLESRNHLDFVFYTHFKRFQSSSSVVVHGTVYTQKRTINMHMTTSKTLD